MSSSPISSLFARYEVFDPGVEEPLHEVAREQAERHFALHVASIETRIEALRALASPAGIELDFSNESVDRLDAWFSDVVLNHGVEDSWPTPETFSLANDFGMYLEECLLRQAPNLRRKLSTWSRRDDTYQLPVISGFTTVAYDQYHVEYVQTLGRRAVFLAEGGQPRVGLATMLQRHLERA